VTAAAVLREARAAGISIEAEGEHLRIRGRGKPPEEILRRLREHRDEILEVLRREAVTPSITVAEDIVELARMPTEALSAVVRGLCVLPGVRVANAEPLPNLPQGVKAAVYFRRRDGALTLERIIGCPDGPSAEVPVEAPVEPIQWPGEAFAVVTWFERALAGGRLPAEPSLDAARRVVDSGRWYRSLSRDVQAGARARARV
jgi:hypothetical protein